MFIGICSRSQVSVYRTIGPLVLFLFFLKILKYSPFYYWYVYLFIYFIISSIKMSFDINRENIFAICFQRTRCHFFSIYHRIYMFFIPDCLKAISFTFSLCLLYGAPRSCKKNAMQNKRSHNENRLTLNMLTHSIILIMILKNCLFSCIM